MAITRCNKCAHLQEQPDDQLGITVACPRCGNPTPVYSTLFFVGKLLEKYFSTQRIAPRERAPCQPMSVLWNATKTSKERTSRR